MRVTALIGFWATLKSTLLVASPVVETIDRLEINWATQKIRFYGQGSVRAIEGSEGYKGAEKRAWQEGLTYAAGAVKDLYVKAHKGADSDTSRIEEQAKEAAHGVVTSTSSVKTIYANDGEVRVYLENTVTRALAPKGLRFRQKEANQGTMSERTGLVLQLDKQMKPRVTYQVVDENSDVLFGPQDLAEEAFRKTLMGRWYRRPTPAELHDVVGKNPIMLSAAVLSNGRIRVSREAWDKALDGHKSMLINGVIALAQP